jgi:hypothetical protein
VALDGPHEDEEILDLDGLPLAVDPRLLAVLAEATVDHAEGAFVVRAALPPFVAEFGLPSG